MSLPVGTTASSSRKDRGNVTKRTDSKRKARRPATSTRVSSKVRGGPRDDVAVFINLLRCTIGVGQMVKARVPELDPRADLALATWAWLNEIVAALDSAGNVEDVCAALRIMTAVRAGGAIADLRLAIDGDEAARLRVEALVGSSKSG